MFENIVKVIKKLLIKEPVLMTVSEEKIEITEKKPKESIKRNVSQIDKEKIEWNKIHKSTLLN